MANGEFWINGEGQNLLTGVDGDIYNPLLLSDEYIIDFLQHIPDARASFNRLVPTLLPEEQDRLNALADSAASMMFLDPVDASDQFQSALVRGSVRRGGEWAPPPIRG